MQITLSKKDIARIAEGETLIDKGDIKIIIDEKGVRGEWSDPDTGETRGEVEIMNEIILPWKGQRS